MSRLSHVADEFGAPVSRKAEMTGRGPAHAGCSQAVTKAWQVSGAKNPMDTGIEKPV
jgi:hypothetical protein